MDLASVQEKMQKLKSMLRTLKLLKKGNGRLVKVNRHLLEAIDRSQIQDIEKQIHKL